MMSRIGYFFSWLLRLRDAIREDAPIASLITHPVVPVALAICLGRSLVPVPLLVVGMLFTMLPDADSIAFLLGIPYASPIGHRGASHSIPFRSR